MTDTIKLAKERMAFLQVDIFSDRKLNFGIDIFGY